MAVTLDRFNEWQSGNKTDKRTEQEKAIANRLVEWQNDTIKRVTPANSQLVNPAQINNNVTMGMDILNNADAKASPYVNGKAGETLKKTDTEAYNKWLDTQYLNNSELIDSYVYERNTQENDMRKFMLAEPTEESKRAVRKLATRVKAATGVTDSELDDIYNRVVLGSGEALNYYAGRAIKGTANSVVNAAQFISSTGYEAASIGGNLIDNSVYSATGKNINLENLMKNAAASVYNPNSPQERFKTWLNNKVEGLVKGKSLTEIQKKAGNLAENAGAMLPAIAVGNIAGMAGATNAGVKAANYIVFGGGAAGNAVSEALDAGADIDTALVYGISSGMLEVLTEEMFAGIKGMPGGAVDKVLEKVIKGIEKNGTLKLLVDTFGEGIEEVVSEWLTPYIKRATYDNDAALASFAEIKDSFESGVFLSMLMNMLGFAATGSIDTGTPAGAVEAPALMEDRSGRTDVRTIDDSLNNYNQRINDVLNEDRTESIKELVRTGLENRGEGYELARNIQAEYARGNDISDSDMRNLFKANERDMNSESQRFVKNYADNVEGGFGDVLNAEYLSQQEPIRYITEMMKAQEAAKNGKKIKSDFLTKPQIEAVKKAVAEKPAAAYNEEKMEVSTNVESGVENGERSNGMAAVRESGSVEARTREIESGRRRSSQAERGAEIGNLVNIRESEGKIRKVSGAEQGILEASENASYYDLPDDIVNQYEDLKAIREKYPNLKIHFIYGRISLSDRGEAHGANKANEIWVSVNEPNVTPEQIAKHEYFHNFIYNRIKKQFKETRENPDVIRKTIVNNMVDRLYAKYHDDGMQSLINAYAELYFTDENGRITQDAEYIIEEILCDAYAGIDVLEGRDNVPARATRYSEAANEIAAEESTENAEAVDDGGGEARFSIARTSKMTLNEQLKTYYERKMLSSDAFYFGVTPNVLSKSGLKNLPLTMTISDFKKSTKEKHNIPRRVLKNLLNNLQNPLFSFGKNDNVGIVVDDIDGDGKKLLIAVRATSVMDRKNVNTIESIYGIENPAEWIKNQINDGKTFTLYNKEKTNAFLQTYSYLASVEDGIRFIDNKLPQDIEEVNNKFSRVSPVDKLSAENAALKEKLAYWQSQVKETNPARIKRGQSEKLAKSFISEYDSTVDAEKLAADIEALANDTIRGRESGNMLTWTRLKDRALGIANDIVSNARELVNTEDMQTYKEIKAYLKGRKINYSNAGNDIADFSDWKKLHKELTVRQTDGTPIDTIYGTLTEKFGEVYFPSEIANPADELLRVAEVLDGFKPIYENPFSYAMSEAVEICANDLIDSVIDAQREVTFADKAAAKLESVKAKNTALKKVVKERNEKIKALKEKSARDKKESSQKRKERELRERIERHVNALSSKLLNPTDKRHIPQQFQKSVARVLESINLESAYDRGEGKRAKKGEGEATKRTLAFDALRLEYERLLNEGKTVEDADLLGENGIFAELTEMRNIPIASMNLGQLTTVLDALKAIEGVIDNYDKMFNFGKAQTITDVAAMISAENGSKDIKQLNGALGEVQTLFGLTMLTPQAYFHRMGEIGDALFKMMRAAQDENIRILNDVIEFTSKLNAKQKEWEKEMHTIQTENGELRLSTAQLMELYALFKRDREQALGHITNGGIIPDQKTKGIINKIARKPYIMTYEQVMDALTKLEAEPKRVADKLQEYASTKLSEYGNKTSMRVYGYEKFNEKNYWKIRTADTEINSSVEKSQQRTTSVANYGMTKAVKPNAKTALKVGSMFDTFANHAAEMATYSAWLEASENLRRILNYRSDGINIKSIINSVHGDFGSMSGVKYYTNLLADIAYGVKGSDTNLTGGLMGKFKAAAVGGNIRVVIQQPTAIIRALSEIAPKYLTIGAFRPINGWKKAQKYAPIALWKSWGYFDTHTGRQLESVMFNSDSAFDKIQQGFMWGAGAADALAWGQLWNACEAEAKAKTDLTPDTEEFYKRVAARFSDIIDKTQVVDGILQRSQGMRSSDGVMKMATSFMAEPTKQYNMFMSAVYDLRNNNPAAGKKLARASISLVIAAIVNAAVQALVDGLRDDDKELGYWEKWLKAFAGISEDSTVKDVANSNLGDALNPANTVYFVKDILSVIKGYDVTRQDMELIEGLVTAGTNLSKAISGTGKYNVPYAVNDMVLQIARTTGLPLANVKRDVVAILNTIANGTDNYTMQYYIAKAQYNLGVSSNSNKLYSILYSAYKDDKEAYRMIYADLKKSGIEISSSKMDSLAKKDAGVSSVDELEKRFLLPEQETEYNRLLKTIEQSAAYKKANSEQRKDVYDDLYGIVTNSKSGEKIIDKIDGKVSVTDYLDFKLALDVVDKPNKNGKLGGTPTNEEIKAALDLLDFSQDKENQLKELVR